MTPPRLLLLVALTFTLLLATKAADEGETVTDDDVLKALEKGAVEEMTKKVGEALAVVNEAFTPSQTQGKRATLEEVKNAEAFGHAVISTWKRDENKLQTRDNKDVDHFFQGASLGSAAVALGWKRDKKAVMQTKESNRNPVDKRDWKHAAAGVGVGVAVASGWKRKKSVELNQDTMKKRRTFETRDSKDAEHFFKGASLGAAAVASGWKRDKRATLPYSETSAETSAREAPNQPPELVLSETAASQGGSASDSAKVKYALEFLHDVVSAADMVSNYE